MTLSLIYSHLDDLYLSRLRDEHDLGHNYSRRALFTSMPVIPFYNAISWNTINIVFSKQLNIFCFQIFTKVVWSHRSWFNLNKVFMTTWKIENHILYQIFHPLHKKLWFSLQKQAFEHFCNLGCAFRAQLLITAIWSRRLD